MKILITGGSGFIGSHLAEHYLSAGHEVVLLDNLRTGYRRNTENLACTFVEGSVTDRATVDAVMPGVDIVYHLAALVSVPESMSLPQECVEINVQGLLNVLESASVHGAKKLVLASSAAIYGNNPSVPKIETMLPEPKSPYAVTKLDGEYYCEIFRTEGKLDTASIRFFNVFGPRQDPKGAYAAAVPIFIDRALKNEPITIFGDGGQTRDFIYVKDIVSALSFAGETQGVHGTFNAGYGEAITIGELAQWIIEGTDSKSPIIHQPERAGDVRHSRASADRLLAAGWKPGYSLRKGLEETLAYMRG